MTYKTKPREVNRQQRSDESQILETSFHQKCPYSSADLEQIKNQIMVGLVKRCLAKYLASRTLLENYADLSTNTCMQFIDHYPCTTVRKISMGLNINVPSPHCKFEMVMICKRVLREKLEEALTSPEN
jgi:hypothetical protein